MRMVSILKKIVTMIIIRNYTLSQFVLIYHWRKMILMSRFKILLMIWIVKDDYFFYCKIMHWTIFKNLRVLFKFFMYSIYFYFRISILELFWTFWISRHSRFGIGNMSKNSRFIQRNILYIIFTMFINSNLPIFLQVSYCLGRIQ